MPASPIATDYPLNEPWAPSDSVWKGSTPSKETTGPAKRYENEQSEMPNGARAALA